MHWRVAKCAHFISWVLIFYFLRETGAKIVVPPIANGREKKKKISKKGINA